MTNHFDVLVLGTGVTESVLSAALGRAGQRVLQVDPNTYYGSAWASLSLSELASWAHATEHAHLTFPRDRVEPGTIPSRYKDVDRHYSIALRPALLPARGPMIEALVRSNVAAYATFRLLGRTGVYDDARLERVPKSKSDIFRDKRISLANKRRLMRFLQATMDGDAAPEGSISEFLHANMGLDASLERAVMYGVALCWNANEPSTSAIERTRHSLSGLGRYGDSPLLVGQFGGAGELTQGFCRASAVHGGVFILGHAIESLKHDGKWKLRVHGVDEEFTTDKVAAPHSDDNPTLYEHVGVLIMDAPINWEKHMPLDEGEDLPETALIVFPPTNAHVHAVMCLVQGEGTFSCPKGQYVYHLSTYGDASTSAQQLLCEAAHQLHKLVASDAPWIAEMYCSHAVPADRDTSTPHYVDTSAPLTRPQNMPASSLCVGTDCASVTHRQLMPNMTETLDACIEAAEQAFWRVVGEHNRDAAWRAAQARERQHAPAEYQGRGGVEPEMSSELTSADVEFFPPKPDIDDD